MRLQYFYRYREQRCTARPGSRAERRAALVRGGPHGFKRVTARLGNGGNEGRCVRTHFGEGLERRLAHGALGVLEQRHDVFGEGVAAVAHLPQHLHGLRAHGRLTGRCEGQARDLRGEHLPLHAHGAHRLHSRSLDVAHLVAEELGNLGGVGGTLVRKLAQRRGGRLADEAAAVLEPQSQGRGGVGVLGDRRELAQREAGGLAHGAGGLLEEAADLGLAAHGSHGPEGTDQGCGRLWRSVLRDQCIHVAREGRALISQHREGRRRGARGPAERGRQLLFHTCGRQGQARVLLVLHAEKLGDVLRVLLRLRVAQRQRRGRLHPAVGAREALAGRFHALLRALAGLLEVCHGRLADAVVLLR
mmetsp:Transcript_77214/g.186895  ORF Transcript_77214/g.186895 Transcript_77214/m.186895 type:complete len:360 (+) Transcript_77214:5-1084(+)